MFLTGLWLYHKHVRPHLGLPDGQTLGEAASIRIEGNNKWKTIIQAGGQVRGCRLTFFLRSLTYLGRKMEMLNPLLALEAVFFFRGVLTVSRL